MKDRVSKPPYCLLLAPAAPPRHHHFLLLASPPLLAAQRSRLTLHATATRSAANPTYYCTTKSQRKKSIMHVCKDRKINHIFFSKENALN